MRQYFILKGHLCDKLITKIDFFHCFNLFFLMKNAVLSIFALLFALSLTSCEKDKEKSFEEKLPGNWTSTQVKIGGVISTQFSFKLNLESSKEYDLDLTSIVPLVGSTTATFTGTWSHDDVKSELIVTEDGTAKQSTWDIKELTDTAMTAELIFENVRYEVKFKKVD